MSPTGVPVRRTSGPSAATSASIIRRSPPRTVRNVAGAPPPASAALSPTATGRRPAAIACAPRIRLRRSCSQATSSGKVAAALTCPGSAARTPPRSGSTSSAAARRPSRRRSNERSDSSAVPRRRGSTRSRLARNFAEDGRASARQSSPTEVGMPSGPGGNGTRPCSVHSWVEPTAAGTRSSPSPRSPHSSTAHGLRARKESGPASSSRPPTVTAPTLPPGRSSRSSTRTSRSGDADRRRCAAARPVTPAPTTTIRPVMPERSGRAAPRSRRRAS